MTLAEYISTNITDDFAALPLSDCRILKERLIGSDALTHVVMLVVPFPHGEGAIASFARIPDYHTFFTSFEDGVATLLKEKNKKYEAKIFADHSPIDERDAACRAGLGVIGDNNLFISKKYGTFVFLGEILCSLSREELEAEGVPVGSYEVGECLHCGVCAECCPSGCIGGGDRSLCVSGLTQKKGDLSDTERDIIIRAGSAWGCDVCSSVCPLNEGVRAEYKVFFTNGATPPACAADVERMSDEEYAKYPFSWRKKEIILRNFKILEEGK